MALKRVLFCLTEKETSYLAERSKDTGLAQSELLRRIIDKDIEQQMRKDLELAKKTKEAING